MGATFFVTLFFVVLGAQLCSTLTLLGITTYLTKREQKRMESDIEKMLDNMTVKIKDLEDKEEGTFH